MEFLPCAEDAHVRNETQLRVGVMSGASSPDFSNQLLGEEDSTFTMLSVGNEEQDAHYLSISEYISQAYRHITKGFTANSPKMQTTQLAMLSTLPFLLNS